eukprot:6307683-Prymnesium_polylepis.1
MMHAPSRPQVAKPVASFAFEPVAAPVQTALGGAARVLVGAKAMRHPSQRQSMGGSSIGKRQSISAGRRSSI